MLKSNYGKDTKLVVGSVLLITLMVIFSVAVDSLIGKAVPYTQVEEINVSSCYFLEGNKIILVVESNGSTPSEIVEVWINNEKQNFTSNTTIIRPEKRGELALDYMYSNGTNYNFKILSERGSTYIFTAAAI
jgi:hypothetical protein